MEPITVPHRHDAIAYIARDTPASDFPMRLPRGTRGEQLREVWMVTNECAVRSTGLVEGVSARSVYPGEWTVSGDQLALSGYWKPFNRNTTLMLLFANA